MNDGALYGAINTEHGNEGDYHQTTGRTGADWAAGTASKSEAAVDAYHGIRGPRR